MDLFSRRIVGWSARSTSRRELVLDAGHWEGDRMLGARGPSAIATLVERQTRYVMLPAVGRSRTSHHVCATDSSPCPTDRRGPASRRAGSCAATLLTESAALLRLLRPTLLVASNPSSEVD